MDKLGSFLANQTSNMSLTHYIINGDVGTVKLYSLSHRGIFLLTMPMRWIFFVICLLCLSLPILDVCLLQPCGHLLGKG